MGNKMSTMNMVILLLGVVLSVFVGFAWMAYCFRYQPVIGVVALFCRACLLCPCSPRPRPRRARRSLATLPEGRHRPPRPHPLTPFSLGTANYHGSNTVFLVGVLMSVVGGVFIVFALSALCYRSVVVHKNFSLCLRLVSRKQTKGSL